MEARITVEIRSRDKKALVEKIEPLFGCFDSMGSDNLPESFSPEQGDSIKKLIQSYSSVIMGLEYSAIANGKANTGFVGGWESEAFAALLARVVFILGFDDFEIIVVEDESVCVIGIFQQALAREYFESLDVYSENGFQFPENVDI